MKTRLCGKTSKNLALVILCSNVFKFQSHYESSFCDKTTGAILFRESFSQNSLADISV